MNARPPTDAPDEVFVRAALAASDDCIKILDLEGRLAFMSEGGRRVMEIDDFDRFRGCPWPDFWTGPGNAEATASIASARAGRASRFQAMANTALGNPRWWDVQVSPIRGPDGKPDRILSVSRDITELKLSQERHELLALELDHRIRNLLTMVQAMANQTLREGRSIEEARAALSSRLAALASAQRLLIQTMGREVDLEPLLLGVLEAHRTDGRILLAGPAVRLSSQSAFALALAVHELATNATKYGALSTGSGQVEINWRIEPEGMFQLDWRESGGPHVTEPSRVGFGSRAIEQALARQLGGVARLEFPRDGAIMTFRLPLEALQQG